jgi:preprotein translocase subunit SecF
VEFFRIQRDIPFMRYALVFNIISFLTFILAVFFLVTRGLNYSIEFSGGVVIEAKYKDAANIEAIRKGLEGIGIGEPQVQNFGTSRDVMVRLALKDLQHEKLSNNGKLDARKFKQNFLSLGGLLDEDVTNNADGSQQIKRDGISRIEFVGPQVGKELAENGALALLVVALGIAIYLAFRFEWKFAVAAIIANLHDIVIILGFFAFFQWEFSLAVLAGVLAVLGYSVNESVVIADRVRENFRKMRKASVDEIIDHAITSTISRTIITHATTETMVLSMLFFGGPTLHYFALALTIGILFGIYSSVLVMAPITRWLGISREDLIKPIVKKEGEDQQILMP